MFDRIEAVPGSAPTLSRGLTHQIEIGDWRAAMDSTRRQSETLRTPDRWNSVPVPARVAKRAYERVEVDSHGCWISTYSTASHGYSQVGWQDRGAGKRHVVLGHRAAWVHVNGQVPLGMTIDHICKTRRCVNPEHLRLLPNFENARRVNGEDFPMGGCRNGHPNTALVPYRRRDKHGHPRWGRTCGICLDEAKKRAVAATRERRRQRGRDEQASPLVESLREGAGGYRFRSAC